MALGQTRSANCWRLMLHRSSSSRPPCDNVCHPTLQQRSAFNRAALFHDLVRSRRMRFQQKLSSKRRLWQRHA